MEARAGEVVTRTNSDAVSEGTPEEADLFGQKAQHIRPFVSTLRSGVRETK